MTIPNPFDGEGIAPIFGISNLWEGIFDQEIDLMAASEKELTRYLVLRFLSRVPISKDLPMKNILVYNYIDPEGGTDSWDIGMIANDEFGSDSLRYSFAKSFSLSSQKTKLKRSLLEGGKRFVHLIDNLKIFFLKEGLRFDFVSDVIKIEDDYFKDMNAFKYSSVLTSLEMGLKRVSKDIDILRYKGGLESKKTGLFRRYLVLVKELYPFCPSISLKVISGNGLFHCLD